MPRTTSSDSESKPIDAQARLRKADRPSRLFTLVYWLIGLGGAGLCYWFYVGVYVPDAKAQAHLAETRAYATELRAALGALNEWSTQESFDSVRAELVKFDGREDADLEVRAQLWGSFNAAYAPRAERVRSFERFFAEVEAFPVTADEGAFREMSGRIRDASGKYEKPLMDRLKSVWLKKEFEISNKLELSGGSGTSEILVRSVPSGAELFLNGRRVGVTPLEARGIRAGAIAVTLKHPKYRDFEYSAKLKEYGRLELTGLEMAPRTGAVEIVVLGASASSAVSVELVCPNEDGETFDYVNTFAGTAVKVRELIVGSYEVTVYVNGAFRTNTKLEVLEGETSRWTARL
ncbi:PEGA domain family [Verrucomicrobiia bacterium DG1235]|nr:PEGA domain family [Verrucomicrobiae bacterium DG1235]